MIAGLLYRYYYLELHDILKIIEFIYLDAHIVLLINKSKLLFVFGSIICNEL